jgi:aminoglycoside/choline kinase family phosphotransferase
MSTKRATEIEAFLNAAGWAGARRMPMPGDASTRSYVRLEHGGRKAIVMDQPQGAEAPVAAATATPEQRRAFGYNAVARLAGADVGRFVAAANFLRSHGLSAPEIFAADLARGFAIIEDLGDALYYDVADATNEIELYAAAAEVLAALHLHDAPTLLLPDKTLHPYDETALIAEVDLLTEWFMPVAVGRAASVEETSAHRGLWRDALAETQTTPSVFVHRDYHAQNLMWLPDRKGLARVGLIDFQDAVAGPRADDLISLVEDARRDVAPEVARATTAHYLQVMRRQGTPLDEDAFRSQMAVMAAQRNAKIAGIFARLYKRDGKPRYLAYLPRVWGYLNRDLEDPALARLKAWYDDAIPRDKRGAPEGVVP